MSQFSGISWLEGGSSWNPITGCTPISPACTHCYAHVMARRLGGRYGYPADNPFRVTWHEDKLNQPLQWRVGRRIFVVSMGDLFHADVSDAWIDRRCWRSQHKRHSIPTCS